LASAPPSSLFDTTRVSRYRTQVKVKEAEITGVLVLKYMDNEWRGSLVNEFGVKAFDFTLINGKCRLLHPVPYLDKWYIRRTIEKDLTFLFSNEKVAGGNSLQVMPNGDLLLKNEKQSIEYSFQPIEP
jgi:hypothetical protein